MQRANAAVELGHAVRDQLLDFPVSDIDLATRLRPDEVVERVEKEGGIVGDRRAGVRIEEEAVVQHVGVGDQHDFCRRFRARDEGLDAGALFRFGGGKLRIGLRWHGRRGR